MRSSSSRFETPTAAFLHSRPPPRAIIRSGSDKAILAPMRLENLTAVVTGAGSGIGLATAELMQQEGARVAALDLNPPTNKHFLAVTADVTDQPSMHAAAQEVRKEFGGADVLICNAGIGATG